MMFARQSNYWHRCWGDVRGRPAVLTSIKDTVARLLLGRASLARCRQSWRIYERRSDDSGRDVMLAMMIERVRALNGLDVLAAAGVVAPAGSR